MKANKGDAAREQLRDLLKRHRELAAEADKLRAARVKAVAAIGEAETKHRRAVAAVESSREQSAQSAAMALAGGGDFAVTSDRSALRGAVLDAEDEKAIATDTLRAIETRLDAVEDESANLPYRAAIAAAAAPKMQAMLDDLYAAETRTMQIRAELTLLHGRGIVPPDLAEPLMDVLGLRFVKFPAGHPESPIKAPDTRALEAALNQMADNPEAIVDAI